MFPFYHLKSSTLKEYLHMTNNTASYALITGATDGIGLGFAHELLSSGFNVLLHGRNPTKLANVKAELERRYPDRQIHTLKADAANFTQADITRLVSSVCEIKDCKLTILVNNVGGTGVMNANFERFTAHTPEQITGLVNLNVLFTVQLTHALLPVFKAHGHRSVIMNISSMAHTGMPYLPVYSGTKGFIHGWSRALTTEMASFADNEPFEILEILVASVQTQQNQTAKPTLFTPSARTMARAALKRIGSGERNGVAAYWPHAVQGILFGLLPDWAVERCYVSFLKDLVGKEEKVW